MAEWFKTQLESKTPVYASQSIHPAFLTPDTNPWIGYYESGEWGSYQGDSKTFLKFYTTDINPFKQWTRKVDQVCGTCDRDVHRFGLGGSERITVYPEYIVYASDPVCFDQVRDKTEAREQWQMFIAEIFNPATARIQSQRARFMSAQHAGTKWVARLNASVGAGVTTADWVWSADSDGNMVYLDCTVGPNDIYKLEPQMLQFRYRPLMQNGYASGNGTLRSFMGRKMEVLIDEETIWDLQNQVSSGVTLNGTFTPIASQWRFEKWREAASYWECIIEAQLGSFLLSTDLENFRFRYVGPSGQYPYTHRYQVVPAYIYPDVPNGIGKKRVVNPDYALAPFSMGFIRSPSALKLLLRTLQPLSKELPFLMRDLAGKARFYIPQDMENVLQNKGVFVIEYEQSWVPQHPERLDAFLYKRQVPEIHNIAPTQTATIGSQTYDNSSSPCPDGPWGAGLSCGSGQGPKVVSITLNGVPVAIGVTSAYATLDLLAAALNNDAAASLLGTWATNADGLLVLNNPAGNVEVALTCAAV